MAVVVSRAGGSAGLEDLTSRTLHLLVLVPGPRPRRAKLRFLAQRRRLHRRELALAVQRRAGGIPAGGRRIAVLVGAEEGVAEFLLLQALVEAVGDRQRRHAAQLLNYGQPLLLVHGIARD